MPKYVEVSVDEVMEKRKEFANDDGLLFKANTSPKSYDEESRSATFVMSAETEDRHRDIVVQSGIKLDQFDKNPIAFFNHKSWETPIGSWSEIKQVAGRPKRTEGLFTACAEGVDEVADRVARHLQGGTVRAASIGFRPLKMSRIEDDEGNWTYGYKFDEIELFECSIVTVPAVREALMKGAGNIKEILSPEVVEEFLEHLKSNPAVAQLVDKDLFESAYREATGNKTISETISITLAGDFEERVKSVLGPSVVRIEKAAGIISPDHEPEPDPIVKAIEDGVSKIVDDVAPEIEAVEDDERKGALSKMLSGLKSLFVSEEETPKIASDEQKTALKRKLKELEIEDLAA